MIVLPSMRIEDGECIDSLLVPSEGEALPMTDPREVAQRLQRLGAVGLHVIDVDAARGKKPNDAALVSILDVCHVPVQVGGGVSSLKRIQELRDTGAFRVVVGSFGVLHPDWMKEAAKCFPDGLVANLDEKQGTVWVKGRTVDSGKALTDVAREYDSFKFEAMMVTSLNGASHAPLHALAAITRTPLWVSARTKSIAELLAFQKAGVKGVVLGQEIYDGTLDLVEISKTFTVR